MKNVIKPIPVIIAVVITLILMSVLMISVHYAVNHRAETASDSTTLEKIENEELTSDSFNFEKVGNQPIGNMGVVAIFYREVTTDVMYVVTQSTTTFKSGSGICVMMNPKTGLPLTYADWLNDYKG